MDNIKEKKPNGFIRFLKSFLPWKGDPFKEVMRKIILMIAVAVLVFSLTVIGNKLWQGFVNSNLYDTLQEMVNDDDEWAKIKAEFPDVDFPEGMQLKYARLYALNQDLVGWLEIDNSDISLPVVQSSDNKFYLRRDFYKKDTRYGNPFLDFRNNVKELDFNTIVYGHNMQDKQIFGQLLNMYDNVDHYKEYPIIKFNTIYKDYDWKVVGAFYTNAKGAQDLNKYVFPFNYPDMGETSKEEFINQLQMRFLYNTGIDLNTDDKIITLSTCSEEFRDARLIIIARQLRDGESTKVDVSKAVTNENPRFPQAWYSKYGKKNPYAEAEQWRPTMF